MRIRNYCTAVLACAFIVNSQAATVLFQDNFDTDTSANWDVLNGSNSGTPDFTVDWAFDYGTTTYTKNGTPANIPAAPNSSGTTRGVKVSVNKLDEVAESAAVNLYSKGQNFSGNYALRFDMWINYNGGEYGGTGSTEFAIFGINHSGTIANWAPPAANASAVPTSDGIWFAVTGEGGAARDYRTYEGDNLGAPLEYTLASGGFLDRDGNGEFEQEANNLTPADYPLDVIYSRPPQETKGVPGKKWVQVEVRQVDGVITWVMDGYVIAEKTDGSLWNTGNVMIGTMDNFNSIAVPGADNFVIFDNVRVVDLAMDPALPRLTLAATSPAAEPSSNGAFTITRTGDTSTALSINLGVRGTATAGEDFTAVPTSVNLAAGATSVDVPITVINDSRAESIETVKLHLVANVGQYEVFAPMIATVEIADDNDVSAVSVTAVDPFAYEKIPADRGLFRISRVGDTSADLTVNFALSGSAQAGTDFNGVGSSVILPAGVEAALVPIVAINNSAVGANRTVELTLSSGVGYVLGTATNATVTIREDDDGTEVGDVLFADNFDTDTTGNWTVNEANAESNRATFNYDYSTMGIPVAPNSTNNSTRGLKLEANIGAQTFTGLSVSPTGQEFSGDYRLSFDMWINYNGPLAAGGTGSTMSLSAGVGTSGVVAQFPGTSVEGVLFSVTGDGGSGSDWRAYAATGAPLTPATEAYAAGTQSTALNNSDAYYAPFGRATAPDAQLAIYPDQTEAVSAGAPGMAWHEVVIEKRGTNFTWFVDNLRIATITLTNKAIGTNIFVGFFDINATQTGNQELSFGVVDNLRVEQLESAQPPGEIQISGVSRSGNNLSLTFTAPAAMQNFVVEVSQTVDGDYAPEPNIQFETVSSAGGVVTRRATIPMTTTNRFFLVRQQ